MAGRRSLLEVDLTCSICCDIFRDPVVLKCSHSFCLACLQQYWNGPGPKRDCPLCRSQNLDDPVPSLTLKNLCETYVPEEAQQEEGMEMYSDPGQICSLHGEKLKLFCLLDQEPICVVCHTSRRHKQHDCSPLSEVISEVKDKIKSSLGSLQEKKESFENTKKHLEETAAHIEVQTQFVERLTQQEFEKLHDFLRAEEAARMEALRREEEQKKNELRKKTEEVERNLRTVCETIGALEEELASEDVSVITTSRSALARAEEPMEDPSVPADALIDVAKHVGSLSFQVWQKMQKMAKYTPVTLDPNTAAPWLVLSDDLTSVHDGNEKRKLPDNPERFDPDTAVLGREGLTAGKHAWDVNVGDNTAWVVGVAKKSVKRKEKVSSVLSNGYLCVYFYHNMYFAGTSPLTRLSLKANPQKVRVLLDCDKGKVSFYDPQRNSLLYSFKHALTEPLFPYLWVGCQKCPLTVEPLQVSLTASQYQ